MKIGELIQRLQQEDPDGEVLVEQTNDQGPEEATDVERYMFRDIKIVGDAFR